MRLEPPAVRLRRGAQKRIQTRQADLLRVAELPIDRVLDGAERVDHLPVVLPVNEVEVALLVGKVVRFPGQGAQVTRVDEAIRADTSWVVADLYADVTGDPPQPHHAERALRLALRAIDGAISVETLDPIEAWSRRSLRRHLRRGAAEVRVAVQEGGEPAPRADGVAHAPALAVEQPDQIFFRRGRLRPSEMSGETELWLASLVAGG